MRKTSQCVLGSRVSTVPTPSTWPCTMCPPSRVWAVTARSRLTRLPSSVLPRLLRRSVSAMTSVLQTPSCTEVTVRQTPLTEMESPRATSWSTLCARISIRAASVCSSRTTSVPTSSTMPVNTSAPFPDGLSGPSVPGGPQPELHVPTHGEDLDGLEGQRIGDRT